MNRLKELDKLEAYLKRKGIQYQRVDIPADENNIEHHQIAVPCIMEEREWDAVCQPGSYGYPYGFIEIMGNIVDKDYKYGVQGWLTAEDVIERIERRERDA